MFVQWERREATEATETAQLGASPSNKNHHIYGESWLWQGTQLCGNLTVLALFN